MMKIVYGLTSLGLLLTIAVPANLILFASKTQAQLTNPSAEKNVIYVDANNGNDLEGDGTQISPFRSLTQALMVAQNKTNILLAPGTYSKATGETFPIIINRDITVIGSTAGQGSNVVIKGGGVFISPTGAGQNVAIAIEKDGSIMGVTLSNPDGRGYGLWIESAKALVENNSFRGNGNAGISVNGNSSVKINNNYFFNNGGNGLVAYNKAKLQIDKNNFEKSGFGVSLTQNSEGLLTNNRITNNRTGVMLEGNAKATLRKNIIESNRESGLVAVGQTQVDLGTKTQPGGNTFKGNQSFDIQNLNDKTPILAYGNQLEKYQGKINFDRPMIPALANSEEKKFTPRRSDLIDKVVIPQRESNPLPEPPSSPKIIENSEQPFVDAPKRETNPGRLYQGRVLEPLTPPQPGNIVDNPNKQPPTEANNISSQPSNLANKVPYQPSTTATNAIEIPVIPAPSAPTPPAKPTTYRVVVPVRNSRQAVRVRGLYPEAFNVVYKGKPMLQVGVFNSKEKADRAINNLKRVGVSPIIAN